VKYLARPQQTTQHQLTRHGGRAATGASQVGAHLLRLQASAGNRAVTALLRKGVSVPVQRAWAPATTTAKTTLRTAAGGSEPKRGTTIRVGTRIVVDRGQQRTESRFLGANVRWMRAVDVRPSAWVAVAGDVVRYIRSAKVGADVSYPERDRSVQIPRRQLRPERRWSDQIGEYVWLESSPRGGNAELVQVAVGRRAFLPPATLAPLTARETHHLDVDALEAGIRARLATILTNAAQRVHLPVTALNKPDHVDKLMHPLRLRNAENVESSGFANWYIWKDAVIGKITSGAHELAASIEHWRQRLYPTRPGQVQVTDVRLTGSDLHARGLGAVFVDFRKPRGGMVGYEGEAVTAVIKPEDRSIEKALFGVEATSLAGRLERLAGLGAAESIGRIRMRTHALHGSLIEYVRGAPASGFDQRQPPSDAMREAMVLAYIAGLSDVHRDNVIYIGDKPYLIDADNALNHARIGLTTEAGAERQSGFTSYSEATEAEERGNIKDTPQRSTSKIMQALVNHGAPVPIVDAVRETFTGKTGRVVPIATNSWATPLKFLYIGYPEGSQNDPANPNTTRWALAKHLASRVPDGTPGTPEPGLVGETGVATAGRTFHQEQEAAEIKADYGQGQIPFYNYEYDTGHVKHNGQVIWHGAPLAEALEKLLRRFPHQRYITDT
jgi:hypothetical protein